MASICELKLIRWILRLLIQVSPILIEVAVVLLLIFRVWIGPKVVCPVLVHNI